MKQENSLDENIKIHIGSQLLKQSMRLSLIDTFAEAGFITEIGRNSKERILYFESPSQ